VRLGSGIAGGKCDCERLPLGIDIEQGASFDEPGYRAGWMPGLLDLNLSVFFQILANM
jgi:hypothetical protein